MPIAPPSLNILDHPRLILDQFGFASGRPLGCEAELRLFIFGQEILFSHEEGNAARITEIVSHYFDPFGAPANLALGCEVIDFGNHFSLEQCYFPAGHIGFSGELRAEAEEVVITGGPELHLGILGQTGHYTFLEHGTPDFGGYVPAFPLETLQLFVSNEGELTAFELPRGPDVSVRRSEVALDQTRYTYDVLLDDCLSVLTGELRIVWATVAYPLTFVEEGSETVFDPNGREGCGELIRDSDAVVVGPPGFTVELSGTAGAGRWRPDTVHLYAIDFSAGASPDPALASLALRGRLAVSRVAGDAAGGAILRLALIAPVLTHAGEVRQARGLSTPFFLQVDRTGAIHRIWLPHDSPPDASWLFRRIAAELQLVEPAEGLESWTRLERDEMGEYEASYRRVDEQSLEKTVQRERSSVSIADPLSELEVLEASKRTKYRFDDEGRVAAVASSSLQRFRRGDEPLAAADAFTARQVAVLSGRSSVHLPDRRYRGSPLAGRTEPPDQTRRLSPRQQPTASYDRLVNALSRDPDGDERTLHRVGMDLVTLFVQRPKAARRVKASLTTMGDRQGIELVAALAASGTPEAERVLRSVAAEPSLGESVRVAAVRGLGQGAPPSIEAVELVRRLTATPEPAIHRCALLTLGTAAYRGAGTQYQQTLVEELIRHSPKRPTATSGTCPWRRWGTPEAQASSPPSRRRLVTRTLGLALSR